MIFQMRKSRAYRISWGESDGRAHETATWEGCVPRGAPGIESLLFIQFRFLEAPDDSPGTCDRRIEFLSPGSACPSPDGGECWDSEPERKDLFFSLFLIK